MHTIKPNFQISMFLFRQAFKKVLQEQNSLNSLTFFVNIFENAS